MLNNGFRRKTIITILGSAIFILALCHICHASSETAVAVAAGAYHTVALKGDGTVVAWGDNSLGQCAVPPGLNNAIAVAAGAYHSIALKSDGTIVLWGDNSMGQLNAPAGLKNIVAVAAGYDHTIALKKDGTIAAWGNNSLGQTSVPAGLKDVTAIAAGFDHSLAVRSDGTLVGWGDNSMGQSAVPKGLRDVVSAAAGWVHSAVLRKDGTVVAWGGDNYGQIDVPLGLGNAVAVAAGAYHTIVLKKDGTVVAWGDNDAGQTTLPAGLHNVAAISGGTAHTVALERDGSVTVIGDNRYGQAVIPSLRVDISPQKAIDAGAQWTGNGGAAWNGSGATVLEPPGDYTISFKDIPGWNSPPEQTVSVGRKQLILAGTYNLSLTANVSGPGKGFVTTDTKEIACSDYACEGTVDYGTVVLLNAGPAKGSGFAGWTGCDLSRGTQCLITMNESRTATASFKLDRYMLTVKTAGAGKGTVTALTGGVTCKEGGCEGELDFGTAATLEAHAPEGSSFLDWAGCDSVEGIRCTVVMSSAKTVTAVFTVSR